MDARVKPGDDGKNYNHPPPSGGFFIKATMLVKLAPTPAQPAKASEENDA
jgi:hypothetical protein